MLQGRPDIDPDRVDLSSLDPSRDALRWERLVRGVAAKATARRRPSLAEALLAWSRPALAAAALIAALAWLPALWRRAPEPAGPDQVAVLTDLAVRGGSAGAAEWFLGLGGDDGNQ